MECKSAEYYISLYLDGALDTATEELLLKHIEACQHCSVYMEQSLEIHELAKELFEEEDLEAVTSSKKIMEDIYRNNLVFKIKKFRVKPAAIAAVLALIFVFVPINSKTVLARSIDWVRNVVIRKPGLVMIVQDRNTAVNHEPKGGKTVVLKEDNQYLKTVEEVMDIAYKAEKKPCLPVDMVEGYTFDGAIYGRYLNDEATDFYIESYYVKQNDPTTPKDNISVKLIYSGPGTRPSGYKALISENEQAKEITADGESGILIKRVTETGSLTYEAHFIISKLGVKLQIKYRTKEDLDGAEAGIIKIAAPLLEKIKKEVQEQKIEAKNVSKVYESNNEEEFYNKIAGLDDRIVKISSIPTGYIFEQGIFIDNPKEIDMYSLSSNYHATYTKGDSKLLIMMQLHTHSEKNSDFENIGFGEVMQREPLAGYFMRIHKETTDSTGNLNGKSVSIDMPDYAVNITVKSASSQGQLMSDQEMKSAVAGIINSIRDQAAQRQILNLGRKIKHYDNLQQFINSQEIKNEGFVVPSYMPANSFFYNAKYEEGEYLLKFDTKLQKSNLTNRIQPIITIVMRKSNMPLSHPFIDEKDIKDITVAGRSAYLITRSNNALNGQIIKSIKLQVDMIEEGLTLTVSQNFNADEDASETELIKIAESIVRQVK